MKFINKILLLAVAAISFYACDKDEEYTLPTSKPVTLNISYSYENTTDFFSLFEATITYKDVKGETKSETITKNWEYKASAPIAQDPKQYLFKINIKNKEVSEFKDSYVLNTVGIYEGSITATHDDNQIYPYGGNASNKGTSTSTITKNKLQEYRNRIPAEGKDITFISKP